VEAPAAAGVGGAVAAAPLDGSNLPPWPTAGAALTTVATTVGCPLAPLPAVGRCRPLAVVGHSGCLSNRRGAQRPLWCTTVGCQI
jgi:hypothetical protein